MTEWREVKLGEIGKIVGGATPNTTVNEYYGGNIPWLTPRDLSNYDKRYISQGERSITEAGLKSCSAQLLPTGSVLFSSRAPIGYVAIALNPIATNQGFKSIIPNDDINNIFLYYLLKHNKEYIEMMGSGTTFKEVSGSVMRDVVVKLPPLEGQKKIVDVLSALDDKIELLQKENETLETLAETIFREKFVENVDEDEKNVTVSYYCQHNKKSLNPKKFESIDFLHYSIPSYDKGKTPLYEKGSDIQSNKYIVSPNTILFSKLNPHKDKRIWLILDDIDDNSICSTEFQIIQPNKYDYLFFLYGWLNFNENYDIIASGVGGTSGSHQRIDPSTIFSFSCPLIDDEVLQEYNMLVFPIFKRQWENIKQINSLTKTRDTLLPKLMNQEIEIE